MTPLETYLRELIDSGCGELPPYGGGRMAAVRKFERFDNRRCFNAP
jgi:hypothetical protein